MSEKCLAPVDVNGSAGALSLTSLGLRLSSAVGIIAVLPRGRV